MKVRLKLFASLRIGRAESAVLELPPGSRVAEAIAAAGLPPGEASLVFRNSRRATLSELLEEGDSLEAFPPIGGG